MSPDPFILGAIRDRERESGSAVAACLIKLYHETLNATGGQGLEAEQLIVQYLDRLEQADPAEADTMRAALTRGSIAWQLILPVSDP